MSSIEQNIKSIRQSLPKDVELICVSKYYSADAIREAYNAGERLFGESRVQELLSKVQQLPNDTKWHFIGHLQTNKVKQVVGVVDMIQSVDSMRVLDAIERAAEEKNVIQKCLLEIHVAQEETKSGFTPAEYAHLMNNTDWSRYPHIKICGLMGMASNTDDKQRVERDFSLLKTLADMSALRTISMGMSNDYQIAIERGSTMIRIGSAIFEG